MSTYRGENKEDWVRQEPWRWDSGRDWDWGNQQVIHVVHGGFTNGGLRKTYHEGWSRICLDSR